MRSPAFPSPWQIAVMLAGVLAPVVANAEEVTLEPQTLPVELGVGYAVRLVDVNADKKLDIVVVDQKRVFWMENPEWKVHTICGENDTKADNVCISEADIDGDGRLDFALGADWKPGTPAFTTQGGTIQWLQAPADPRTPWKVHPIGEEPSTHRMRFADLNGNGRPELIVAPLQGRGTTAPKWMENGVRVLAYEIPSSPDSSKLEPRVLFDELHVVHSFQPIDFNGDGKLEMLVVSFEGVFLAEPPSGEKSNGKWRLTKIGTGDQESSPNRGASEIKLGRLAGGTPYVATIEPWHGDKVVVYTPPKEPRPASGDWLWTRTVVDAQLKWGHAVWCANLDGDGDEELVVGVRDDLDGKSSEGAQRCGVRIYDPLDAANGKWSRQLVDSGAVAVEDLATADLDGDGRQDVVAVGRATHNAKIYWNRTPKQ